MGTLFEDIRDGIRDGIELVVDKTEEYGKIGKLQIDILTVKRNIEKLFSELGGHTYEVLSKNSDIDFANDTEAQRLIAELKELEQKLDDKKNEIKKVKEEKDNERKEREKTEKSNDTEDAKVSVEDDNLSTGIDKDDIEDANIVEDNK